MRTEWIDEAAYLIGSYYDSPDNGAGGNLHIVFDDANWDRSSIEYCAQQCLKEDDIDGWILTQLLLQLTPDELAAAASRDTRETYDVCQLCTEVKSADVNCRCVGVPV